VILIHRRRRRGRHRHGRRRRVPAAVGRAELVRGGGALRSIVLRYLLAVLTDLAPRIPDRRDGRWDVHGALGDRRIRCYRATANRYRGRRAAVANEVDGARSVFVPEVDHQYEERRVDVVKVDFLARPRVAHDEADAGRGSDGAPVL
jgi:hypothetical protein